MDEGEFVTEFEAQIDRIDQKVGRPVLGKSRDAGLGVFHAKALLGECGHRTGGTSQPTALTLT